MGQELVYCFKCGNKIKAADFDKGQAFRISDKTCCSACAVGLLASLPQEEQNAILHKVGKAKEAPSTPPPPTASSHKVATFRKVTQRGEIASSKSNPLPIVIGLALVAVIGIAVVIGSSNKRSPAPRPVPSPEPIQAVAPAPESTTSNPSKPAPIDTREESAKKALEVARAADPKDLLGKVKAYRTAVWESEKTTVFDVATRELAAWLEKWRTQIEQELSAVDDKWKGPADREEFKGALELLYESRNKYPDVDWTVPIDQRITTLKKNMDDRFRELKEQAVAAKKRGEDIKKFSERVGKWGLDDYRSMLDTALAEVADPPEEPAKPAVDHAVYKEAWGQAMNLAANRQYFSAAKLLQQFGTDESKADLELLRTLRILMDEIQETLSKWPAGRSLSVSYYDDAGAVKSTSNEVNFADRYVVEFRKLGFVPFTDMTAESLLKLRKDKSTTPASAFFQLLDGSSGDASILPEKYRTYVAPKRGKSDKAARELFGKAAKDYRAMNTRSEAGDKYRTLLNQHLETEIVKRNEEFIRARSSGEKEYALDFSSMKGYGTFKNFKDAEGDMVWINDRDSDNKVRDNYVDIDFYAAANTPYRLILRIGVCCMEKNQFWFQGTDLKGFNAKKEPVNIEPGTNNAVGFVPRNDRFQATHAGHGKDSLTYGWVILTTMSYPTAGIKKVRIVSNNGGFAVKYLVVSAENYKDKIPRLSEIRSALKLN